MTNLFGEYARYYDLLYRDKDYPAEARFVARLLDRFTSKPASATDLLDLACGTGRHAQELTELGYTVDGSDLSADMLAVATDGAIRRGQSIRFHHETFQTCDRIGRHFDAVLAMFSAINYLNKHEDIERSLSNIRGLLQSDGVFIFDFWNGNAVLGDYAPIRMKRVREADDEIIRISNTSVDAVAQVATVKFEFILINAGRIVREFSEVHTLRYFFPQEMVDLLASAGLEVIHRCPFLLEDNEIGKMDWNLTYVARRCR